jgi:hypothetical protein
MRRALALAVCLLAVLPFMACRGNDMATGPGKAALGAVIVVKGGPPFRVPIGLTNPSDGIVRYPEGGLLVGALYQKGSFVKPDEEDDKAPLTKDQVRELKPGETATFWYQLPYHKLQPGWYELRLTYWVGSVEEEKFGLTPMKLEQTILIQKD